MNRIYVLTVGAILAMLSPLARMGSESELIKAVREWRQAIRNDQKRKTIDELLGTE